MKTTKLTQVEWDRLAVSANLGDEYIWFERNKERSIPDFIERCIKFAYSHGVDDGRKQNQDALKAVIGIETDSNT